MIWYAPLHQQIRDHVRGLITSKNVCGTHDRVRVRANTCVDKHLAFHVKRVLYSTYSELFTDNYSRVLWKYQSPDYITMMNFFGALGHHHSIQMEQRSLMQLIYWHRHVISIAMQSSPMQVTYHSE